MISTHFSTYTSLSLADWPGRLHPLLGGEAFRLFRPPVLGVETLTGHLAHRRRHRSFSQSCFAFFGWHGGTVLRWSWVKRHQEKQIKGIIHTVLPTVYLGRDLTWHFATLKGGYKYPRCRSAGSGHQLLTTASCQQQSVVLFWILGIAATSPKATSHQK